MGNEIGSRCRMRGRWDRKDAVPLAASLLVLLLLAGCATGGGRRSRGSASETAAKAADQTEDGGRAGRGEGRTRTKTDHKDDADRFHDDAWEEEDEDDEGSFLFNLVVSIFSGGDDHESDIAWRDYEESDTDHPDYDEIPHRAHEAPPDGRSKAKINSPNLQVGYSHGNLAGDAVASLSTWSVMYSFYKARRTRLHFGIYWGTGKKGGQAVVQNGIDRIKEYGVDFGARSYLTPRHTLAGCYVLYGLRMGGLVWRFANPVQVPAAGVGETITSDAVLVFTPYLGLGLSVLQVKPLHVGASVCWGPRISLDRTFEEFDNDLFPTVGELRWTLGLSVFF